ncbi:MAG TPA: Ig-like domain-containing protein [Clostridiales bacterium]|nr:Ig-like domain-containing protein [Clostridiales bacterium]
MKRLNKLLAVLLALTLIAGITIVPTFAAEPLKYENEAKTLNQLKLFKGTSETEYKPNLEARLLREESVALLLRMFGLEAEALKLTDKEAADILNAKFKDAGEISGWAVKYVAYAVKNEIIAGRPDGKFAPGENLIGREYAKMLLSMLGYKQGTDFQFEFAIVELCNVTDFAKAEAVKLDTIPLLRDDVVGLSFSTLKAEYAAGANKGKTVIAVIVGDDKEMQTIALDAGLIEKAVIKSLAEVAAVEIKVGDKLNLPEKVKATYSDGTEAEVAVKWDVTAVKTDAAGEYKAVGTVEGFEGKLNVAVKVVSVDINVVGTTADNMKEILVSFNSELDSATVVKDNFAVAGQTVKSVKLLDSKKEVLITLDGYLAPNPKEYEVTVKNVKNVTGKQIAEVKVKGNAFDKIVPEAVAVKFVGPNAVEIEFSEYIDTTVTGSVTINNGIYGINSAKVEGKKVKVEIGTNLPNGDYTFKVEGFKDYAGFLMPVKTFEVAYAADTSNPTVSVKEATQTYVIITFSKPVKGLTTADVYHTYTAWQPLEIQVGGAVYNPADSASEFKLIFVDALKKSPDNTTAYDRPVPVGSSSLVVKKTDKLVDLWGVKLEGDATLPLNIAADLSAPEVSKVEVTAEDIVKITFSKEVIAPTKDNFVIKKADGAESTTGYSITYADKVATLTFNSKLAGGVYTIEIKDVKDTSLAVNKMVTVIKEITITDKTPHDTTKTKVEYVFDGDFSLTGGKNKNPYTLYLYFNEKMAIEGANSVLSADNYRISYDGTTYAKLPANTSIAVFVDSSKIKITIPVNSITAVPQKLLIGRVADVAGNLSDLLSYERNVSTSAAAPLIEKVQSINANTVKLILSTEIKSINASKIALAEADISTLDFSQDANKKYLAGAANYVNKNGKAEVTITLKADNKLSASDALITSVVLLADNNIKSLLDIEALAGSVAGFAAEDKFAPSIKAITAKTGENEIAIQFTEAVDAASVSRLTFTVKDRTVSAAVVAGDTVTLTVSGDAFVKAAKLEITQQYPITDAVRNEYKADKVQTVEVKDAAV